MATSTMKILEYLNTLKSIRAEVASKPSPDVLQIAKREAFVTAIDMITSDLSKIVRGELKI